MKNIMQDEHVKDILKTGSCLLKEHVKDILKTGSWLLKVLVYVGIPLAVVLLIFVLFMVLRLWNQTGLI